MTSIKVLKVNITTILSSFPSFDKTLITKKRCEMKAKWF